MLSVVPRGSVCHGAGVGCYDDIVQQQNCKTEAQLSVQCAVQFGDYSFNLVINSVVMTFSETALVLFFFLLNSDNFMKKIR